MHGTATCHVYLIAEGDLHKIGISKDPSVRLEHVAPTGRIIHTFPSASPYQVENALHRRFDGCLAEERGWEWFRLTPADVEAICCLGRTDSVDDLPAELRPPLQPLTEAHNKAWNRPLVVPEVESDDRPFGYRHFVTVCAYLQVARRGRPIILPVEAVASACGVAPITVSRYIRWARQDGYLKRLRRSRRCTWAAEYVFNVALFPGVAREAGAEAVALFRDSTDS